MYTINSRLKVRGVATDIGIENLGLNKRIRNEGKLKNQESD